MDYLVADPCHELPGNAGGLPFDFFRDILGSFTNDLQRAGYCMFCCLVRKKIVIGDGWTKRIQVLDLVKNMPDVYEVILQPRSPRVQPVAGGICRSRLRLQGPRFCQRDLQGNTRAA